MKIHHYPEFGHVHPYPTGEDILDPSQPVFRVWIPEAPMLVLGYSQEAEKELNIAAVEADGVPVYKRKGGGGAVLLSPGSVCVALRMKRRGGFGMADYFSAANGMIRSAVKEELEIDLEPRGISDLARRECKVSGSSLYLPRACAVYLASILVDADLSLLDRYLRHPSREPDYRDGRTHAAFVQNLAEIPGRASLTAATVKEMLERRLSLQDNDINAFF